MPWTTARSKEKGAIPAGGAMPDRGADVYAADAWRRDPFFPEKGNGRDNTSPSAADSIERSGETR